MCWNRQTGTFEVRVSMTCGFKSHRSHHTCGEQVARRRFSFSLPKCLRLTLVILFAELYFGMRYTRSAFYFKIMVTRSDVPPFHIKSRLVHLAGFGFMLKAFLYSLFQFLNSSVLIWRL